MRLIFRIFIVSLLAFSARAEVESTLGPFKAPVGDVAELEIPRGYRWVDKAHVGEFMKSIGNTPSPNELGAVIGDRSGNEAWFAIFSFDEVGYIKDAASEKLDPDELIKNIKDATSEANAERRKQGYESLEVVGWGKPPFYNAATQRLEWSIIGRQGKTEIINYKSRILGRNGVMSVILVCDTSALEFILPEYQRCLENYAFTSGGKYAEWKEGDKIAAIGLAALVLGGVAAKTGLLTSFIKFFVYSLKYAWKLIVLLFAAMGAAIKKFLEWVSGKKEKPEGYVPQSTSAHAVSKSPSQAAASANGPPSEAPPRLSEAQPTMDDPAT